MMSRVRWSLRYIGTVKGCALTVAGIGRPEEAGAGTGKDRKANGEAEYAIIREGCIFECNVAHLTVAGSACSSSAICGIDGMNALPANTLQI